jgi:hypothetical protein
MGDPGVEVAISGPNGSEIVKSIGTWRRLRDLIRTIDGESVTGLGVRADWGYFSVFGNEDGLFVVEVGLSDGGRYEALGGGSRSDADEVYFVVGYSITEFPAQRYLSLDQAIAAGHFFFHDHGIAPDLSWTWASATEVRDG